MLQVPLIIEALDEEQKPQNPIIPIDHTRMSTMSTDSGFDDPSQIDREGVTHGIAENCLTATTTDELHRHSSLPVHLRVPHGIGVFDSIRVGTKHHRKSMLLSDLCVVTVSVPTEVAQGQKGRGAVLKFRFSPYTQIEFLRIAILKVGMKPFIYESILIYMVYSDICIFITETLLVLQRFHERYDIQVPLLSKLHLCRYLEVSFDVLLMQFFVIVHLHFVN